MGDARAQILRKFRHRRSAVSVMPSSTEPFSCSASSLGGSRRLLGRPRRRSSRCPPPLPLRPHPAAMSSSQPSQPSSAQAGPSLEWVGKNAGAVVAIGLFRRAVSMTKSKTVIWSLSGLATTSQRTMGRMPDESTASPCWLWCWGGQPLCI